MRKKRVILDGEAWGVMDSDFTTVSSLIEDAMSNGKVVTLPLLTADGCPVKILFQGGRASVAVIDDGAVPKPTEIAG